MAVNHALTTQRTPRPRRRQHLPARHLQLRHRRRDQQRNGAGLPQRLDLGARPGVGRARVHAGLRVHGRQPHADHRAQRCGLLHRPPPGRRRPLLRLPGAGHRSPARLVGRGHRRLGPAVARAHRARRVPRADLPRRGEADPDLALGAALPLTGHARAPRASCCTPPPSTSRATSTTASSTPTTTSSRRCCAIATSPPERRRWVRRPAWSRRCSLSSPSSLSFSATQGAAGPAPQALSVANTGGGSLPFTATTSAPWLTVSARAPRRRRR